MARRGVQYVGFWLLVCGALLVVGLLAASSRYATHSAPRPPTKNNLARVPAVPAHGYAITDLGILPGGWGSDAKAINDSGQVVGSADTGNALIHTGGSDAYFTGESHTHGFLWQQGRLTDLPPPGPHIDCYASSIDEDGRVVGYASNSSAGRDDALLWSNGKPAVLPTLGGRSAQAAGICGSWIVGEAALPSGETHACLWEDGKPVDLGTLGGKHSGAVSVNGRGDILGFAETLEGFNPDTKARNVHAVLWSHGSTRDVGALLAPESEATAINQEGQVCGVFWPGTFVRSGPSHDMDYRALFYDGRKMRDLGTLGSRRSEAFGLNSAGQVVGASEIRSGSEATHAFLWSSGKVMDLNRLLPKGSGWVLERAAAINDHGQIAGSGTHGGKHRAFLLTPKP